MKLFQAQRALHPSFFIPIFQKLRGKLRLEGGECTGATKALESKAAKHAQQASQRQASLCPGVRSPLFSWGWCTCSADGAFHAQPHEREAFFPGEMPDTPVSGGEGHKPEFCPQVNTGIQEADLVGIGYLTQNAHPYFRDNCF